MRGIRSCHLGGQVGGGGSWLVAKSITTIVTVKHKVSTSAGKSAFG